MREKLIIVHACFTCTYQCRVKLWHCLCSPALSCGRVCVCVCVCLCVCVCVFLSEQLLTGARDLRLIKLQEGCAGTTFTSCRKTHYKKRIGQAGQG